MPIRSSILGAIVAALLFSPILSAGTGVLPPPDLNNAQRLVFFKDHLEGVAKGSLLDYAFTSTTKGVDSFTDNIEIRVTDVVGEGKRDLEFNFLSGPRHIDFTPAKAYKGNPVIIHFLERDISLMAKDTGGSNGFFRNRIRDSFKQPIEVRDMKFQFNGKELVGTEIIVTPFVSDPYADNFRLYVKKRYEFIFCEQVPGGIYRIHTQVPGDNGEGVLIDEEMTFRQITPAI